MKSKTKPGERTSAVIRTALLLALVLAVGCKREAGPALPAPQNVLAQVGTEVITTEQFQAALARRGGSSADPKVRRAVLDELIRLRAEVQEARRRGYEQDPEIVASHERALANKLRTAEQEKRRGEAEVTLEEIGRAYEAEKARFARPVRLRVAQLFVEAPAAFAAEKRSERRALLEGALARLQILAPPPAAAFGPLAAEVSFDQATKFRGGDVGYVTTATAPPEWTSRGIEAAFTLEQPGQCSEIVETPTGFYAFRLLERAGGGTKPLAEVEGELRARLVRAKERALEASLAAEATRRASVTIHESAWNALPAPPTRAAAGPPALPR